MTYIILIINIFFIILFNFPRFYESSITIIFLVLAILNASSMLIGYYKDI